MQNGNLNNFMGTECIPLLERFQLVSKILLMPLQPVLITSYQLSDVVGGLAYRR